MKQGCQIIPHWIAFLQPEINVHRGIGDASLFKKRLTIIKQLWLDFSRILSHEGSSVSANLPRRKRRPAGLKAFAAFLFCRGKGGTVDKTYFFMTDHL